MRTVPSVLTERSSLRSKFCVPAVQIGGRDATVHQKVAAREKPRVGPHKPPTHSSASVRGAPAFARRYFDHVPILWAPGTSQFISGERSKDDSGTDRIYARAALAPPYGLCHYAQRICALGNLVGVKGVFHLVGLKHR